MSDIDMLYQKLNNIEELLLGQKSVLTLAEASKYTNLSKSYLYKLTCTNAIPFYKPQGKYIFFDRLELEDWLLRNRIKTEEEIKREGNTYLSSHTKSS